MEIKEKYQIIISGEQAAIRSSFKSALSVAKKLSRTYQTNAIIVAWEPMTVSHIYPNGSVAGRSE